MELVIVLVIEVAVTIIVVLSCSCVSTCDIGIYMCILNIYVITSSSKRSDVNNIKREVVVVEVEVETVSEQS